MQIEVSNLCSLACSYCPHPDQVRPKGDMSWEVFKKCIEVVKRSDNPVYRGKQFVWLNHFGEPLLHPLLPDFIAYAVSQGVEVSFATNGVDYDRNLFPRELWMRLRDAGLRGVMLSAHVKSRKTMVDHVADIVDVIALWNPAPENLHDWAGQVDMTKYAMAPQETAHGPCDYESHDMFAVRWDGKLAACCYDIEGGVGLSVDDVLDDGFTFRPISLCAGCQLGRGDVDWIADPLPKIVR